MRNELPPMLSLIPLLSFGFLLVLASPHDNFKAKVAHKAIAHNQLFHDSLLGQLESYRNSLLSPPASSTTVDLASPTPVLDLLVLAASADNVTSPFADNSTASFQLYTTDSLPSPSPSTACAAALTATIQCNSTIPLMRYNSNDSPLVFSG